MILFVHILAGGLIASVVKPLFLALILALMSHYFLDLIPHWQYSIENIKAKNWRQAKKEFLCVFLDGFSASVLIFFLSENIILSFAGAFFACLPDGLHLLYRIFPNSRLLAKHHSFHKIVNYANKNTPAFWGILTQTIISFAIASLL